MAPSVSQHRIKALNKFLKTFVFDHSSQKLTLFVNNYPVGMIRSTDWERLKDSSREMFTINEAKKEIHVNKWQTTLQISEGFADVLHELRGDARFPCLKGWRNELNDVMVNFGDPPVFMIERAATSLFGVKRYGVHINGFVKMNDEVESVWLQRRSKTKEQFPGLLDILVSGGLSSGTTPREAAIRECYEEASICEEFCHEYVKSVGSVSFIHEDELGTSPLTFFCYDAALPADFEPKANDGEVEEFVQYPVSELLGLIMDPTRFKVTSAPTVLDFLIRHSVIDARYGSALLRTASIIHQNLQEDYPKVSKN